MRWREIVGDRSEFLQEYDSQYGLRENPRPAMKVWNGSVPGLLDPVFGILQGLLVISIRMVVLRGKVAVVVDDI